MMQVFTQECITRGLPGFEHEDLDPEESAEENEPARATKVKARGRKASSTAAGSSVPPSDSEDPQPAPGPSEKKKRGSRAAKPHEEFPELGKPPRAG
jgi:hypothetical protein